VEDIEAQYSRFASSLHFFEFLEPEYYKPEFSVERYKVALDKIATKIPNNEYELAYLLRENPQLFDVIEQIFQLRRFTNAHYLNFLFDVELLNRSQWDEIYDYMLRNINLDEGFRNIFGSELKKNGLDIKNIQQTTDKKLELMSVFKISVDRYSSVVANDTTKTRKHRKRLYERIRKIPAVSERIATYLFNQRDFAEVFQSIKPKKYLEIKRIPVDGKSYSGNYGLYVIERIFSAKNIPNVKKNLIRGHSSRNPIGYDESNFQEIDLPAGWAYAPEVYAKNITKRSSGALKKFDYIIFSDKIPQICIETNFYSTSGTKIGINENEYRMLNEDMSDSPLRFWWITDGNYWLTNDGKKRYIRCIKNHQMNVYNYNQFKEALKALK